MAGAYEERLSYFPKDLDIDKSKGEVQDYFTIPIVNLKIDSSYAFNFQWVFPDGTRSKWSDAYTVTTNTESVPAAPTNTVTGGAGFIKVSLPTFPANALRVDVRIAGGTFGSGTVVAESFTSAGTKTIVAAGAASPGNAYVVTLLTVTPSKINGDPSSPVTVYVTDVGETIQSPTNPSGFSIDRILSGIKVNWAGTYANGTFTGFEAIKIYVGTSATATAGTYTEAGVMTGNNVKNAIVVPVDGTYLRYNLPVYVHAAAVNKSGTVGSLQANVASDALGARSAIGSDLDDLIITNGKLVDDAVSAAKILTGAITTTKIADDAITSPKIIANAITADKITTGAVIADKIATNAITAGKILAGTIDVSKLAAGTISVNNLEAGNINATSFIRAGSGNTGARVEISSAAISGGPAAGFYIYNSAGTAILSAPLTGGLSITGGGSFTGDISGASGTFAGNLSASNGLFSVNNGLLTAQSGTIGGWTITGSVLESAVVSTNKITLNPATPKIALIQNGTEKITIDPVEGIKDSTGNFILTPAGNLTLKGSLTISTNPTYNYWTVDGFRAGAASTYLTTNVSTGVTTIYSSDTTTDTTDGNTSGIAVPQKIEVNSTQVIIQGLAGVGNGLTRYGDLIGYTAGVADSFITQYRSAGYVVAGNEPSATYGVPARYRMIVADPYDYNKLKRGFGVYYGVRSSAPPSSTGFVGDVWVSW
jgi:hypothetical protein